MSDMLIHLPNPVEELIVGSEIDNTVYSGDDHLQAIMTLSFLKGYLASKKPIDIMDTGHVLCLVVTDCGETSHDDLKHRMANRHYEVWFKGRIYKKSELQNERT